MPEEVKLYVYDLSNGMARSLSLAFLGTHIEGIWHTSVVVYGIEYYFGGGIQESSTPGITPYGKPLEIISMGHTNLSKNEFLSHLSYLATIYTPERYHLLDNNCNHFTNDVCKFLVGKEIPKHITDLPQNFSQTPLGMQLRPMLDSMFSGSGIQVGSSKPFVPNNYVPPQNSSKLKLSKQDIEARSILIEYQHGNVAAIVKKIQESVEYDSDWIRSLDLALVNVPSDFVSRIIEALGKVSDDLKFAWFDLLRIAILRNPQILKLQLDLNYSKQLLTLLVQCCTARISIENSKPIGCVFTGLKLLCNVLASPDSPCFKYFTSEDCIHYLGDDISLAPALFVTKIFLSHFLPSSDEYSPEYTKDIRVKQVLSSIAFNLSVYFLKQRHDNSSMQSEYHVETVSALVHFFTSTETIAPSSEEEEVNYRFICSLWANLVFADQEIIELAKVLGLPETIKRFSNCNLAGERWSKVFQELLVMIE